MIFAPTIAGLLLLWLRTWARFRDPFHPLIFLLPPFIYLYGWMPLEVYLTNPERFAHYAGGDFNHLHHALVLLLIGCLVAGVARGGRGVTPRTARWVPLRISDPVLLRAAGVGLGLLACGAWLFMVAAKGGLVATYGTAYGQGAYASGYLLEAPYLGLPGAIFIFLTRTGRGMRPIDWMLVALCVAPVFLHAMLGARRGPAFLAFVTAGGGYVYFMRKRVPLVVIAAGGGALGFLMLFLVANRGSIYIGSSFEAVRNPLEYLIQWHSNEYLISNATVRYTQEVGGFYGLRELVWIVGRVLPAQVWPSIWTDLPALLGIEVNLLVNGGVSRTGIMALTGWMPSMGAAEGYAASLWFEFQYLAPAASFAIGWFYGRMWANARDTLAARVVYLLMAALSLYLVMQALDPWLFRLILLGLPAYGVLRLVKAEPLVRARPAEPRPAQPRPAPAPAPARPPKWRRPREPERRPTPLRGRFLGTQRAKVRA
ncbi:transmembrane prediction [Stappia sp. 22II-S9-Z10]|nr:transmembrane prediction [Stappia sp. 22II-S9-Z10]